MIQPTPAPTLHPWRRTIRTVFAGALGLVTLLPYVLAGTHLDGTVLGGQALAVSAVVTRVLAIPAVDAWLTEYMPFLAATPRQP